MHVAPPRLRLRHVIGGVATLLAIALALLGTSTASAAPNSTRYVAPWGSDANPCTAHSPCRTISHAVATALAGDTVHVEGGTYKETVTISKQLRLVGDDWPTSMPRD